MDNPTEMKGLDISFKLYLKRYKMEGRVEM